MSSPMAGVAVINAIVFGVYGQTQKFLDDSVPGDKTGGRSNEHHLSAYFLAGASAGLAQSPVCSPIELAKTRLQLQELQTDSRATGGSRLTGPVQCLRQIQQKEGFRGCFKGLGMTLLRETPSYGVYFATYELLTRSEQPISTVHMLLAGGFAGTASWFISYPVDVLKSRLQADSEARYSGAFDCLRKSLRAEGYACLFRGLNSTILRAFPTNAATFAVVTWTMRLLGVDEKPSTSINREKLMNREKPEHSSWNALDRYGETSCQSLHTLGGATSGYLHQLANAGLVQLIPHAKASSQSVSMQVANTASSAHRHFDESRYFDSAREMFHY